MVNDRKLLYLCRPDGSIVGVLNGVQENSVECKDNLKDYDTLSFTVSRFIDIYDEKVTSNGYDELKLYMEVFLEGKGYFQMQEPKISNDGFTEVKHITCYSCEKELEQKDRVGFAINTGITGSIELDIEGNKDELGFTKRFITFYNPNEIQFSLMNYVLDDTAWSIGEIDRELWDIKLSIDEDSTNVYALLTSTIAPKSDCIFTFDIVNRKVNAIYKDNLGRGIGQKEIGNVFIGFRNLAQTIDIDCSEDSVYTRFNVRGEGDLDIREINFGDQRIMDLSYFLNTNYFNKQETINKINAWINWRDKNRDNYTNYAREIADLEEKITEIKYRVPNDGDYWDQWNSMTEDLLKKNLTYYSTLLNTFRISIDPNPKFGDENNKNETYIPCYKKTDGSADDTKYLEKLKETGKGYYTYFEIINYIIPNIKIAIDNIGVVEENKKKPIDSWETNWDLYGTIELQGKADGFNKEIIDNVLKDCEKSWDQLTDKEKANLKETKEGYDLKHEQYVKYKGYLGDENTPGSIYYALKKLNAQIDTLSTQKTQASNNQKLLYDKSLLTDASWKLSRDEISAIRKLFHDTDYTNSNILTTSIDTTLSTLDVKKTLYDDAMKHLSEQSQPQYSFSTNIDNLFSLEEFATWKNKFNIGNFFRLGIRDDYSVKLRLIGITYNPCDESSNITVEFSNMVTGRDGRSDFTHILDNGNNSGSKNSISIGNGSSGSDSLQLNTDILKLISQGLSNSSNFSNAVNGAVNSILTPMYISTLTGDYLKYNKIDVDLITGDTGKFNQFFTNYLSADVVSAKALTTDKLSAALAEIDVGKVGNLFTDSLTALVASINVLTVDKLSAVLAEIDVAKVGDLFTESLTAMVASINVLTVDKLSAVLAEIDVANVGDLFAESLTALISATAQASIDIAYITKLVAKNITVADLKTATAMAETLVLVSKGTDSGGNVKPAIAFSEATQQFYDSDGNIRVQIGQDGNGEFNFIVRGKDGTTALFDENGITKDAIPNSTIKGDMLADAGISKDKLDFPIIEANDEGGIDITQIYDGDGELWGISYAEFKDNTEKALKNIEGVKRIELTSDSQVFINSQNSITPDSITLTATCSNTDVAKWIINGTEYLSTNNTYVITPEMLIDRKVSVRVENVDGTAFDTYTVYMAVDGSSPLNLEIISSKGGIFKNGDISTTLTAYVYRGEEDVTNEFDDNQFIWTRTSNDSDGDVLWNQSHFGGTKNIEITTNDVYVKATFNCNLIDTVSRMSLL